jgi:hypothetical protein
LALRTDLLDLGFNKMKSWWKGATQTKMATELTGAEIKRLAAELQVVAGRRGVTTGAAVTAIATALGNEVAALVMCNPSLTIDEISDMVCHSVREMAHAAANPPSSASKLFLVMRGTPTRTRTRISNRAGLLAASGGLGGCNARRGAASSRMTDRPSTGQIGEWCFARQTLMEGRPVSRWQRLSTARALHSIGARRLRRVGREWIWRLD